MTGRPPACPAADPRIEEVRLRVGNYITALMVDGGSNVAACERAMDAALDSLAADLTAIEGYEQMTWEVFREWQRNREAEAARHAQTVEALAELVTWTREHLDALSDDEERDEDDAQILSSLDYIFNGHPGCTDESDYTPARWDLLQRIAALAVGTDSQQAAT